MNKKIKLLSRILSFSFIFSNINSVKYFAMETKQKFYDSKFDILKTEEDFKKYCSGLLIRNIQNWCNNFAHKNQGVFNPYSFHKYFIYHYLNSTLKPTNFYLEMESYLIEILKTIYNIMILDNSFHYEEYSQEEFLNYFENISFGTINELLNALSLFALNYSKHIKKNRGTNFKFDHTYWINQNNKIDNLFFKSFGKWMNEIKSPSIKQNNITDNLFFKSSDGCVSKINKECVRSEYCELIDAQLINIFKHTIRLLNFSLNKPLVYISYEQEDQMEVHVE